jgi:hypothetical protein
MCGGTRPNNTAASSARHDEPRDHHARPAPRSPLHEAEAELRAVLTARILLEADFEGQIARALHEIERPIDAAMVSDISRMLERAPEREWREHIEAVAAELTAAQVGRRT